jgi:hypothetical protein
MDARAKAILTKTAPQPGEGFVIDASQIGWIR